MIDLLMWAHYTRYQAECVAPVLWLIVLAGAAFAAADLYSIFAEKRENR